ncbi:transcriptional regulator, TetR family [Anaerosphaera aminiphila DSM 21120]|uniref:Transcriptional regulator, TetR family n=1 Tax=Anaerosphaera aminiphila DSM 21120 TaxID=1120995 RepID=A0A1M5Q5X6_9FIRM|nr:TetR/AcrR family transcriptional regulator [Anaerosphaera aminiphila]SHH09326.1 transcriptional regulator, TetR family [Anaerosphaera aminiphila DSM 21120]
MLNKSYHHNNLKKELIEKGIEIISEHGLEKLSLRRVALECGVSHSAPYSHFKDKDELLSAMKEYITDKFAETLEETVKEHGEDKDILLYLGRAYVKFFLEKPQYFSFLYGMSDININLSIASSDEFNYKPYVIYKNVVLGLFKGFNYSQEKMEDLVITLWAFIYGITSIATMKNVKYDKNLEDKLSDFFQVFNFERSLKC